MMNQKKDSPKDYPLVESLDWASWLESNHDRQTGAWVIFAKKTTKLPTLSFEEALDIALAFGWIDISIRSIDEKTYGRKFTPRRPESSWTPGNVERAEKLINEGKMRKSGLEAFHRRLK